MIRFTWLQFRAQALVVAGALAVLAVAAAGLLHRDDGTARLWLGVLVLVAPALIGMFWGAPLVAREFEDGTFRLAWTQSVTRARWMAVKLAVVGLASMTAVGLLSLVVTWWAGPLDRADLNQFATFDQRGIAPLGYAAFAFALGVTIGIAGSLATTRVLSQQLWQVSATDPLTFFGVAMLLGLVALVACYIPARRATGIDPLVALRYE